jgi:hypothetical protein
VVPAQLQALVLTGGRELLDFVELVGLGQLVVGLVAPLDHTDFLRFPWLSQRRQIQRQPHLLLAHFLLVLQ